MLATEAPELDFPFRRKDEDITSSPGTSSDAAAAVAIAAAGVGVGADAPVWVAAPGDPSCRVDAPSATDNCSSSAALIPVLAPEGQVEAVNKGLLDFAEQLRLGGAP